MSGRVRVTLADGRRVTGFRKTLRRQSARTPAYLLPDWELSFELPAHVGFALPCGPYPGVIGVQIGIGGHVSVRGKNRAWLFEQAVAFLKKLAPEGLIRPLHVVLTRPTEPGPTWSGPLRPGRTSTYQITWNGRTANLISATALRPISVEPIHAHRQRKASGAL